MKRKYLNDLINWKNDPQRKPLFVWGARQVGKSFLVEELFAKHYFPSYIRIDCLNDYSFDDFVEVHPNAKEVLEYLSTRESVNITKNTLLIFDEAQECLPIISMMKIFCEKYREIPIIVTGSLVRIKLKRKSHNRGSFANKDFLFPVGKINQLYIYPMSFDEYLLNFNESLYNYAKDAYLSHTSLDDAYHNMLLSAFHQYILIGGLPEVVDTYLHGIKKNDINAFNKAKCVLKDVYDNYLDDMSLYQASPESVIRSKAIFENIYAQLNKENKNFKCSVIEKNTRTRDFVAPIDWLTTANIVLRSYNLKEVISTPLINSNDSLFRLYLADTGLYAYQSSISNSAITSLEQGSLAGYFYENYVATELVSRSFKLFYWTGKRNSEFEFILDVNGHIVPIDVKKSKGSLNSLVDFRNHNKKDIAIKVSQNKYGFDQEKLIVNMPFYFLTFYLDDIKNGIIPELNQK